MVRWTAASAGRPAAATNSGVSRLAMRSLPPPMRSFSLYSAGLHRTGRPNSSNTWLKATRWPYRSVSASTPSQSKIRARAARSATPGSPGLARAAEAAHVVGGQLQHRGPGGGEQRRRVPGGALLRLAQEVQAGLHVGPLERGGDVHLGAATRDQVAELGVGQAGAAVQRDRDRLGGG